MSEWKCAAEWPYPAQLRQRRGGSTHRRRLMWSNPIMRVFWRLGPRTRILSPGLFAPSCGRSLSAWTWSQAVTSRPPSAAGLVAGTSPTSCRISAAMLNGFTVVNGDPSMWVIFKIAVVSMLRSAAVGARP